MQQSNNRLQTASPHNVEQPVQRLTRSTDAGRQPERSLDLRYYFAVVRKRLWLMLTIVVVCTTLATLQTFRTPSLYEATTTIRIEQANALLPGGEPVYSSHSPEYWNTQIQSLQSPQLMQRVALALDLPSYPSFLGEQKSLSLATASRRMFGQTDAKPALASSLPVVNDADKDSPVALSAEGAEQLSPEQSARLSPYVGVMLSNLTVQPVPNTNLIAISFKHPDPNFAAKVPEAIARLFIKYETNRETAGSQSASTKLAQEIATLQMTIRQQEEQRVEYMQGHDLPLGQAKGQNITLERLGMLSGQLLEAENERKNLQSAYDETQKSPDIWSVPVVHENKIVQEGRTKLREMENKRAGLATRFQPEWPELKELDAEIASLKGDLERVAQESIAALKSRYEASAGRVAKLRLVYEQERAESNRQSQSESGMSSLNQQIETTKSLHNQLFQLQKELEIKSNGKTNDITVTSPGATPTEPIPQPRMRTVGIVFLLSLFAALGLAFLLDFLDNTLKSTEDVNHYLQMETLAMIPAHKSKRLPLLRGRAAASLRGRENSALALVSDSRSPLAEAYRHLRTSLTSGEDAPKTILVTSGKAGEGKTTTAINMAIAFALNSNTEVLLLDCDLRRPRMRERFGLEDNDGLIAYLSGRTDLDQLRLHQVDPELPNLKIIAAGRQSETGGAKNPADLLLELQDLLALMSGQFTHIIIDSPPANSFTDASIISRFVDGVVVVAHSELSSRRMVKQLTNRLSDVGAHVCGVVLNYAKTEGEGFYYNYDEKYYATAES